MIAQEQVKRVLDRIQAAESALSDPAVLGNPSLYRKTVREHASLKHLERAAGDYFRLLAELDESRALAGDPAADPDMAEMARSECARIESELPAAERAVQAGLLPPEPADARNAIFEIRAGTGGEEAALFAAALFRMYSRFCDAKGWKTSVVDANGTELGGYKEIVFTVAGEGAYGAFKFESGGHRVQRVPETEAQGRIHTSAATVIVFPEADEEDAIALPESELRVDIFCAGGHGGQGVNTTYSAIRITHLPTGLTAQCQDERSQHRNKEKAMGVLKARLLDQRRQTEAAKLGKTRLDLRGSGDRSQRIRTYNFPQNRMTDHRVNLTLYSLDRIMEGALDPLIEALSAHDLAERLARELA
ncbi:MAG: peptide chain release factor 1 [Kiritimatiellae bacterium]|nr:peptide chain release factor 1 [Kiritimatiellia bacterium]MDD3546044.1 peptide chain release factor 1 [Kiritimatiellia bacterium]MDD4026148.1 peptide chain release factor 1 [Kiritimatiellia bacterium]MDD4623473.1 peptide chain release factor 1 [Kiritimatiellia bacterium]